MNNKNFDVFFDCGSSKIRVGAFNKENKKNNFYIETSTFLTDATVNYELQKVISSIEENTQEYLDDVNLMIDDKSISSIGISISKKLGGSKIKKGDIQFLIQDAKQQVLKTYTNQNILHIIIQNYKIDNIEYIFLPHDINCNLISLDILFICVPKKTIEYYKEIFFKLDISVNQFFCSSYAKSINYKNNFDSEENISFIDIGFNKTSIICYNKDKIIFLDILPIGSNHITKDISKILEISWQDAENTKLYFDNDSIFMNQEKVSLKLVESIISSRIDEILKLCTQSIKLNLKKFDDFKVILIGEGSKIVNKKYMENISFLGDIDFFEESIENICESGLKLSTGLNKQEVVMVPKKQIKQGFFEKLFLNF